MTELFGIDFAEEAYDAFGGELEPATLHVKTGVSPDLYGKPMPMFSTMPAEGILSAWDTETKLRRGYTVETVKIMLLAIGEDGPLDPKDGDRITIAGRTYSALHVAFGAGQATFDMAGVPV